MTLAHIHAFTAAMQRKDLEAMLSHMADDIILKTPLVAESFQGKAAIRPVVEALLAIVDKFDFHETNSNSGLCSDSGRGYGFTTWNNAGTAKRRASHTKSHFLGWIVGWKTRLR
jgi:ketosteroid isomerase-like protein